MIITVTLNAALDRSLTVPILQLGQRHRASDVLTLAGGTAALLVAQWAGAALRRTMISTGSAPIRVLDDWRTIFFTLASGVDAFVAAYLADFPARIEPEARTDGSVNLKLSVLLPSRRPR